MKEVTQKLGLEGNADNILKEKGEETPGRGACEKAYGRPAEAADRAGSSAWPRPTHSLPHSLWNMELSRSNGNISEHTVDENGGVYASKQFWVGEGSQFIRPEAVTT